MDYTNGIMTGKELKAIRTSLNWTQAEMAAAVGVADNTIARYERDELGIKESTARLILSIRAEEKKKGTV
jgi:transcriptional regulator with XRE-family HTH domain